MVQFGESDGISPFLARTGFSVPLGFDYSGPVDVSRLVDGTLAYTVKYDDPEYPYLARLMVKRNTALSSTERAIRIERPLQKVDEAVVLRVSPILGVEFGIVNGTNINPLMEVRRFGNDTLFALNNGAAIRVGPGGTTLHIGSAETAITPDYQWIQAGDRLVKLFVKADTYGLTFAYDDNPHEEVAFITNGEQQYREILRHFFQVYPFSEHLVEASYSNPSFFIEGILRLFAEEDSTMYFENLIREVQKLYLMKTVFSPLVAEMQGSIPEILAIQEARRQLISKTIPPSRSAITQLVNLFDPSMTVRFALNDEAEEIMRFRGKQNPPGAKK